tara:strand:+ start:97770 stop:98486 length:717 start_codon:yes stop_codon:yes gene_type:complete
MSRNIDVITFDLDNTLWDVEPTLIKAEQVQRDWLLQYRAGTIEHYDHDQLWEFKKGVWKRNPQLAHHVSQMRIQMLYELQIAAGYGDAEARTGAEQAFAVFLAERHKVVLYEEALEVLELLAREYRLGALTNGNADVYKTDAGEYFDFAFLAEDIGRSKPHPDMFHAAIAKAGVLAENIVHVGDNPEHDILGARSVGMHTVWMNSQDEKWSGDGSADYEITNLKQLPHAVSEIASRHQ